ncbi:MAG: DUF1566 domain-containing protein [Solidesulfovibrio sp. DCME]|uniref:Lcl C-terminal domain-containing protein n=1 Tax=Solidesulfovibrio sp. DCME TaxID=3447380 RepID=UPI003D0B3F06
MHLFIMIMSRCLSILPPSIAFPAFVAALLIPVISHESMAYSLTKTGISTCYNNTTQIDCPSQGQDFYGQDGTYRTGKALSYAVDGDTVTDKVTGLVWQAADSAGTLDWDAAVSFCENLDLAGHTDWRLPTRKELLSITDDGQVNPAIDPAIPSALERYWTVSKDGDPYTTYRYFVNFSDGQWGKANYSELLHVRCVRGGAIPESTYAVNPDGITVRDTTTGLVWERAGSDAFMNWKDAMAWCEAQDTAGKTDWRLPNKKELETLVYDAGVPPLAIAPEFIEPSTGRRYWSGSPFVGPRNESWTIHFDYAKGVYIGNLRESRYYVRCVRGGEAAASFTPANALLLYEN